MSDQTTNEKSINEHIDINISQNMIKNDTNNGTEKSRKGRKKDEVRKYFILKDNNYNCTLHNCKRVFSCNTSVSVLKISSVKRSWTNIK